MEPKNRLEIEYCVKCHFMMRAAWMAQELLRTFDGDLDEVALLPSKVPGIFQLRANGTLVWDRKTEQSFPESREIKSRIRDIIAPNKDLGHSEKKS